MTESTVSCVVLDSAKALRQRRDELAQLAEIRGAASSLVQHPDWLLFELESRGAAASPHVVVASDSTGRILGFAPLIAHQHDARLPLGDRHLSIYRGRALRLLGSGVVASPANRKQAEDAIASALRRDRTVRVLRIQETELPNSLALALSRGVQRFAVVPFNLLDQLSWAIPPQSSAAAYVAAMDAKRRGDLTRRLRNVYKKLGEQGELKIFDAPANMDEYCRLMNQVYARSWHAKALPIDWEQSARSEFLVRLAEGQHVIGHLLMLGSRPIAYVHGYRLGGRYVLDDTGYDEEFAALGIGSALVFQAVMDLLDRYPGERIDFGYGDNQYKRVLAGEQVPCGSLYIVRGVRASTRFRLVEPLRWIYQNMHRMRRRLRATKAG